MPTEDEIEEILRRAVSYIRAHPGSPVATVARNYGVPRLRLARRLQGRSGYKGRPATVSRLTQTEETMLCRYIDRLERANLAVRREFITEAANTILFERCQPSEYAPVGPTWTARFLRRHQYEAILERNLESSRSVQESTPQNAAAASAETELAKAYRLVEAAEKAIQSKARKCSNEAAKKARAWRIEGKLWPCKIHETGKPVRYLKRV